MSSRLYLISAKTWPAYLFILTLKLSFDDIQIGPRNFFAAFLPLNTHEMYTQKNILGAYTKTRYPCIRNQLLQSQFTEFFFLDLNIAIVKWNENQLKKSDCFCCRFQLAGLFILAEKQFNKMIEFEDGGRQTENHSFHRSPLAEK